MGLNFSHSTQPRRGREAEDAENRLKRLCDLCSSRITSADDQKLRKAPADSGRPADWLLKNLWASLNLLEVTLRPTIKPP